MNNLSINAQDPLSEQAIRLVIFLLILMVFALLEYLRPRRQLHYPKGRRWSNNFALSLLNTATVSVLLPLAGVSAAVLAGEKNWGLLNVLNVVPWISIPIYILVFDFTIYWQHRLFHTIKPLWRLHRVHHTDLDYDVSTGIRFHPLSILMSSIIKLCLIFIMGPLAVAVLISEILLNATSMFNHSNLKLPQRLDEVLRYFLVTPDMHRVHHSVNEVEHNSNFGFNFPWWDKLFGTYQRQPQGGHEAMKIGITNYGESQSIGIGPLLAQPFQKSPKN